MQELQPFRAALARCINLQFDRLGMHAYRDDINHMDLHVLKCAQQAGISMWPKLTLWRVLLDLIDVPSGLQLQVELPLSSGNYVPISQQWLLVRAGTNVSLTRGGQQIYNPSLGKCLDVCKDASPYSQCGHVGNVFLEVKDLVKNLAALLLYFCQTGIGSLEILPILSLS